jgi:hypothetical protein
MCLQPHCPQTKPPAVHLVRDYQESVLGLLTFDKDRGVDGILVATHFPKLVRRARLLWQISINLARANCDTMDA